MKGPIDIEDADVRTGAPYLDQPAFSGKVFLREEAFLEERGLSFEPATLSLDGAAEELIADATAAPYVQGAEERTTLLAEAPPSPDVAWRTLGPAGIPNGQTYGTGKTTVAGRVSAIGVDPGDSDHLLVGGAAAGIWETRDGGASWTPRTDEQPTLSIGAIAFDPSEHTKVYAGTGEGNSAYFHLGQGILVSHDGGSTWELTGTQAFAEIGFYRLVVNPRNGRVLLAATTGGAALSSDAGQSWSLLHRSLTWDVSLAFPNDEAEILLAAPDGLFVARGGGAPTNVALPGLSPLDPSRDRLAVAHVLSDPGQAYAFAGSRAQDVARLWHRATLNGSWDPVQLPTFSVGDGTLIPKVISPKQARYDWYVAVPLEGDEIVYLGAIELVKGVRTGDHFDWSDISSRIDHGDSIHPDQHTMAFDPQQPHVIYAGNDGGVFRSRDDGDSWESLNAGLAISEVEYLAQRPDERVWLLAGLQDNGTIRRDAVGAWSQIALGDGGDCGANMAHPDICFHSYYAMPMDRSMHRGDNWKRVTPPDDSDRLNMLFYPPLEVHDDLVVKAGQIVHVSSDNADHWTDVALPQPPGLVRFATALAVPTADTILAGTISRPPGGGAMSISDSGDIFAISRDNGTWSDPQALTRPRNGWISDLLVDPANPQRYWVTFSNPGAVFRSDNAGQSWTDVTSNLPQLPVNAVVSDPANPDRVWVACDVGVLQTTDAGGSWAVFGTGLPNALAVDLLFYAPERLLRVGTRSRGVWEAAVG